MNDNTSKEYSHEYYQKNKERIRKYNKQYYVLNREKMLSKFKEYYHEHKEKIMPRQRQTSKKRQERLKYEGLTHYSSGVPKCACCGETEIDFLTFDHINGKGRQHRIINKINSMAWWLKKNNYPNEYQVLCFNCNFGKERLEGCPHKRIPIQLK